MKRIIEFQVLDEKYSFKENDVSIFEIDKTTRQLNVKDFYVAFFANGKDYSEIEFSNPSSLEKDDKRIYDAIYKLITDICSRLKTDLSLKIESLENNQSYIMEDYSETEKSYSRRHI